MVAVARDIHTLDCVAYLGSYSFLDGALGTPNNINSGLHPSDYQVLHLYLVRVTGLYSWCQRSYTKELQPRLCWACASVLGIKLIISCPQGRCFSQQSMSQTLSWDFLFFLAQDDAETFKSLTTGGPRTLSECHTAFSLNHHSDSWTYLAVVKEACICSVCCIVLL